MFWVGGSTAYDGVTNRLATTSGGAASVAAIAAGDTVTFDANSPAAAAVTTSAAISCTTMTLAAGFTGSLTMSNTLGVSGVLTHTQGILNTNSQVCTLGSYSGSNANTRTVTLGSSAISCSTGAGWTTTTITGLTITANTAVVTITGAGSTFSTATSTNWNGLSVVLNGGGAMALAGTSSTYANATVTGTAVKTDTFTMSSMTFTGRLTINGQSAINRVFVSTGAISQQRTYTAALVTLSNADFMDIATAGVASPFTGTSLGDCLGNSGITFDTPATQTWSGNTTGNWSTSGNWTSRVPLPQDNVAVTGLTSGTITVDMPRMGANIDFTGSTGGTLSYSTTTQFFGSSTFVSNLTVSGAANVTAAGRSSLTVICAGKRLPQSFSISAPGGTYTLSDNFAVNSSLLVNYGTLTASANVTCTAFSTNTVASTRAVNLGSGIWTLTGTGKIWDTFKSGLTFTPGTATIVVSDASSTTKNMVLANDSSAISYPTISYINSGTGTLSIENASGAAATTINNLNIGPGRAVTFGITGSWIINNPNMKGVPNGYVYLPGVASNYASTPDSAALSITGDIDMRVRVAMDDWTPTTGQDIFSKWGNSPQQGFDFHLFTNGKLRLYISSTGSNQSSVDSSVAPVISDGSILWVRATWRASDGRVQFFTADGSIATPVAGDFTQLGTDQTIALASIFDNTAALEVGSERSGVVQAQGKFYRAQLRNGLDGTLVYDANFTSKAFGANSFTESSAQAATVTINGTLAQAGDGRVLINTPSPGSPASFTKASGRTTGLDYVTLQDNNASGGAAFYAGANSVSISNVSGWIFKTARTLGANTFRTQGGTRTQAGTRTVATARSAVV